MWRERTLKLRRRNYKKAIARAHILWLRFQLQMSRLFEDVKSEYRMLEMDKSFVDREWTDRDSG